MGGDPDYECKLCYDAYGRTTCDNCKTCRNRRDGGRAEREERERREREERERREREERERIQREFERREREARERREREAREREEREEREREKRQKEIEKIKGRLGSLLRSISYKIDGIYLSDFTFNTSCVNQNSIYLYNKTVSNLYCSMNSVGSAYSESINTSLNRERVVEQKNNYLYNETDELSLENLRTLNTGKEKIRFSKKF